VGVGAVMGGAAESCLRMLTVSRAAHQALHTDVTRHGIRAARKKLHLYLHARASSVHARRRVSFVRPPARPARSGHRPTPPTPTDREKNAKHTAHPCVRD